MGASSTYLWDLQHASCQLLSDNSNFMSALILLLERAIEWVVMVRYSCSRHLATACGMRCQMPLVGGMGEPHNGHGWSRLVGMQGARRLRQDKRGIPRLAGESPVGSSAWHA